MKTNKKQYLLIIFILTIIMIFISTGCKTKNNTFSGICFNDLNITYDGNYHNIYCENVPEFAEVEYVNNNQKDVGDYIITAYVSAMNYETLKL